MIDIRRITKTFDGFVALRDVSLTIAEGELVALLGPSGSGKTTLLRIIAGLDFADEGEIHFEGRDATRMAARDRRVGFVFQHFALFRHMTVRDNIAFGPRVRGQPKALTADRVDHLIRMVQLEGLGHRYPSQLSGGQRQRVALARAMAIEPRVLLLDEPFGALDAKVRKELRRWLRQLHDELGITGIFVTHDQEEALEVADRVVVMNRGAIEQVGTPTAIYDNPATPFVYRFLGNVNSLPCSVHGGFAHLNGLRMALRDNDSERECEGAAFVRPHEIDIVPDNPSGPPGLPATVRHSVVLGPLVRIELELSDGAIIEAEIARQKCRELGLDKGSPVLVSPRKAEVFLEDGRRFSARLAATAKQPRMAGNAHAS
jgi:sulfate transport system ATP-binding protein